MPRSFASVLLFCIGLIVASHAHAQVRLQHDIAKYSEKIGKRFQIVTAGNAVQSINAADANVKLEARPVSCVTLREGQPCFIKLAISWQSDAPLDVCLVSDNTDAGECWSNEVSGTFKANLYLLETTVWQLRDGLGQTLDETEVSVAWVYQSRRGRRNWRLF